MAPMPSASFGGGLGTALINQRKKKRNPFGLPTKPFDPMFGLPMPQVNAGNMGVPTAPQPQGNPYADLIRNLMNQQRADLQSESVADAASRDAALRRMLVSYGEIPDFSNLGGDARGILGKAVDPRTRELAAKNTAEGTSVKARLEEANKIAQRQIPAHLAARGMLQSGQTGHDLQQQQMTHKRTMFDTLNELLGNAEGVVGNFLSSERARQRMLADLEMQSMLQAFNLWGGDVGWGSPMPQAIPASVSRTTSPRITRATRPWRKSGGFNKAM